MDIFSAIVLAVVEGLTEFLPVSSTGHLVLASWLMGIQEQAFVKDYTVMVQFGAILAVVFLYFKKLILNTRIYPQVFCAFLPAGIIGFLVKKKIDLVLGNVWVVAWSLLLGGILLVLTDRWIQRQKSDVRDLNSLPPKRAVIIGCFQCLAFIPGVSRAAASIWGGIFQGLTLVQATEFSFFLAVPTLAGATFIKAIKIAPELNGEMLWPLVIGNVVAFVVGVLSIRYFVTLVGRFGLRYFGYYRIIVGVFVLVALYCGESVSMM